MMPLYLMLLYCVVKNDKKFFIVFSSSHVRVVGKTGGASIICWPDAYPLSGG